MKISEIRRANKRAGFHFFDPEAMRFFDTRVESDGIGRCFVTSEQFHGSTESGPRLFTVRRLRTDGSIENVSEFQQFGTRGEAVAFARKAKHERSD